MKANYGIEKIIYEDIKESSSRTPLKVVIANNKKRLEYDSTLQKNILFKKRPVVVGQKYGNCSTRSIRECLRDNISEDTFRGLYDFIVNTPYSRIISIVGLPTLNSMFELPDPDHDIEQFIILKDLGWSKIEQTLERVKKRIHSPEKNPGSDCQVSNRYLEIERDKGNKLLKKYLHFISLLRRIDFFKNSVLSVGGFTKQSKRFFLIKTAHIFSDKHKLDKELTKRLYLDIFDHSLRDIDLPLIPYMLEAVNDQLLISIKQHSGLTNLNYEKVLESWQDLSLQDNSIHPIIKAPIQSRKKALIQSKKELLKSLNRYSVFQCYRDILSKQRINAELNTRSFKTASTIP